MEGQRSVQTEGVPVKPMIMIDKPHRRRLIVDGQDSDIDYNRPKPFNRGSWIYRRANADRFDRANVNRSSASPSDL
jgi:hypothetical protein